MTLQGFIEFRIKIQANLLRYLDSVDGYEEKYSNLLMIINDQDIAKDIHDLKLFLILIGKISKYHNRSENLYCKLCQLFRFVGDEIKHFFSSFEIFNLFKNNKFIIQILVDTNIIQIDEHIKCVMMKPKYIKAKYLENFCLQKKDFPSNEFIKKRQLGENDLQICELIRKDQIDDFIEYTTKTKFPLNSKIKTSVFETNQLLLKT